MANNTNNAQVFEVLYRKHPPKIDTAVIVVLNDQVEYHEDSIYDITQELKHLKIDKKEELEKKKEVKMYEEYLKGVYLKNSEIYQKMLASKSVEWSYEEELRIILESKKVGTGPAFLNYPVEALKSIIIGKKCLNVRNNHYKK